MPPRFFAATFLLLVITACGNERDAKAPQQPEPASTKGEPAQVSGRGSVATSKAYAGATRLTTLGKSRVPILRIPGYGELSVKCSEQGRPRTTFTLIANTSTTIVSVQAGQTTIGGSLEPGAAFSAPVGPTSAAQQTWQLSRSTKPSVETATIVVTTMSGRPLTGANDCFAAAQAVVTTARG